MLETWNFLCKYTHVVSKYRLCSTKVLLILLMSVFYFAKKSAFLAKIIPLLKATVWQLCEKFFSFVFSFCKIKVTFNENVSFTDSSSEIRFLDGSKLAINRKNDNDITISQHDVIVKFFLYCFVSFVKFSYWCKFHVHIITGSGVRIIGLLVVARRVLSNRVCLSFRPSVCLGIFLELYH